jgi:hypothetical protein
MGIFGAEDRVLLYEIINAIGKRPRKRLTGAASRARVTHQKNRAPWAPATAPNAVSAVSSRSNW